MDMVYPCLPEPQFYTDLNQGMFLILFAYIFRPVSSITRFSSTGGVIICSDHIIVVSTSHHDWGFRCMLQSIVINAYTMDIIYDCSFIVKMSALNIIIFTNWKIVAIFNDREV